LMDRAIAEKLTSKEIKQQIKNWRGDYLRVWSTKDSLL
jgi:hypothetical protein